MDGLIEYLHDFWKANDIYGVNLETRYRIKEAGIHYIIDNMELSGEEREELKRKTSERVCLEQALASQMIPLRYLIPALEGLPPELKSVELVSQYIALAEAVSIGSDDLPSPYGLKGQGPYAAVRQEGIRMIVQAALQLTDEPLLRILNIPERADVFHQAGVELRNYLDNHPSVMGAERN